MNLIKLICFVPVRCIGKNRKRVIEGEVRSEELAHYLQSVGAPKSVWISEDATSIVPKVNYDVVTSQLVGLVLPIDKNTGCPITQSFMARTETEIIDNMKKEKSISAYVVMAQPLDERLPPFMLQIYGTNNTFTGEDVSNRWKYYEKDLAKYGISVAGYSSDADSKLLSVMCQRTMSGEAHVVQDSIHVATKGRNRLLNPNVQLKMGNSKISVEHLKTLMKIVPKSIHGLTLHDVCPNDRQNFGSFEKIIEPRVLNSLKVNVPDSQATIKYLNLFHDIISSYMDHNLDPIERIIRIWRSVYFCRIWRESTIRSKYHKLAKNFIASPTYKCIEINARNLIELIRKFRDNNTSQSFIPPLFQSQTCEKSFRQFRSMGTTNFTRINFSVLELLYMVGRVEVQNEILHFKLLNENIVFPKLEVDTRRTKICNLPSENDISNALQVARKTAIEEASKFGLSLDESLLENYPLPCRLSPNYDESEEEIINDEFDGEIDEIENIEIQILNDVHMVDVEKANENQHFIEVNSENGSKKIIRKSSLVWLLSEKGAKLSNDRLKRVQTRTQPKRSVKRKRVQRPLREGRVIQLRENVHIKRLQKKPKTAK